ncbi:universal stress protein [Natronocalculus amylovorans]|uniref:Universal stress protein n=1 Tax=Natronocalculus amylovorans TaxID=2917812 RepID=A0AAE3FYV1_9EURY|nr:universal stress protein [Natronocalculus amylovorans]MCL9818072.1 universal stress protein [Natronocalculus amylovorans]NUE03933.1 universal stress protein [Halorubraceae archaeon YAN]
MAYDQILIGIDGSEQSLNGARQAIELAAAVNGCIHAVYVIDTRREYDNDIIDPDVIRSDLASVGEDALARIESAAIEHDVSFRTSIHEGKPATVLLQYADRNDIDAIFVGSHGRDAGRSLERALLGSTTDALLRQSSVPVTVCPPK